MTEATKHRAANPPLEIGREHWRSRWLVTPSWGALHRVSEIEWEGPPLWDADQWVAGEGMTVCGWRGHLMMPGIFSRMGRPRCAHCCDALGIPRGDGNPFNEDIDA